MHENKDQSEESSDDSEDRILMSIKSCPSCKGKGHKPHNCDKDPNIKTTTELFDDLERVQNILGLR